jgi:hypothetical protein
MSANGKKFNWEIVYSDGSKENFNGSGTEVYDHARSKGKGAFSYERQDEKESEKNSEKKS